MAEPSSERAAPAVAPVCPPDQGGTAADSRFPRAARLTTARDFSFVFADARRSADRCFTVLYRVRPQGAARLGLAIAKKQLRRAVDRQRIKRLIREGFRQTRAGLPGVDIVVLARPGLAHRNNDEIHHSLTAHWQRISRSCAGS